MTDTELGRLYAERRRAWQRLGDSPQFLKDLSPAQRRQVDHHSAEFRRLDAQIVAELRKRSAPARPPTGPSTRT